MNWLDRAIGAVAPAAGLRRARQRQMMGVLDRRERMVPKLSDTQAVVLAAAAARSDLSVLPAPEALRLKGAALERTLKALLGRGLIAAAPTAARAKMSKWVGGPNAGAGDRRRLIITPAGLEAIGVESQQAGDDTPDAIPEPRAQPEMQSARPGGKLGVLLDAVSRPEGATLDDLTAASGWLPHTTRAAITRLRQRGYDVRIATMGTRKAYRLVPPV